MKQFTFYLAIFLLGFQSCQRYDAPEFPIGNNPVFKVDGTLNGQRFVISADGEHIATSTYAIDSLGVTYYEGALANCQNCAPVFAVRWRSTNIETPSIASTMQNLNPAYRYGLNSDTNKFYDITLTAKPIATPINLIWNVNGEIYSGQSVAISIDAQSGITKMPVTLITEYANGCVSNITDTVFLPNHGCDCKIHVRMLDSTRYEFKANTLDASGTKYFWSFENGVTASSETVLHPFAHPPADAVESVFLSTQSGDCQASSRYDLFFPEADTGCAINFEYSISERHELNPGVLGVDLGEIEIEFLSDDGTTYYTMWAKQDVESFFEVEDVEPYFDRFTNSNLRSMKVNARFNCILSNGNENIRIQNGVLTLPLGLGAN